MPISTRVPEEHVQPSLILRGTMTTWRKQGQSFPSSSKCGSWSSPATRSLAPSAAQPAGDTCRSPSPVLVGVEETPRASVDISSDQRAEMVKKKNSPKEAPWGFVSQGICTRLHAVTAWCPSPPLPSILKHLTPPTPRPARSRGFNNPEDLPACQITAPRGRKACSQVLLQG